MESGKMPRHVVVKRRLGLLEVVIGPREGEELLRWHSDYTPHHLIVDVDFGNEVQTTRVERQMFHADEVSRIFMEES